jgi:hypothetical protein
MTARKMIEVAGNVPAAEAEAIRTKVGLVMDMSGKDDDTKLSVLTFALVFTAVNAGAEFSSVIRMLATVYEEQFHYEGDEE